MQGTKAKTSAVYIQDYKNWHVTLVEPHTMLMVEDGEPCVQGVHLVLMYETSRRVKDQYAVPYLVTVGEQQDNGQCMFFKTLDPHREWVEVYVLASYSDMGKFYKTR